MNVKKIIASLIIIFTLTSCSHRDDGTLLGNIIGAGLGALVLFAAYTEDLSYFAANSHQYSYFEGINLDFG